MRAERTGDFEADLLSTICELYEEERGKSGTEERGTAIGKVSHRLAALADAGDYISNDFLNYVSCSQFDYSEVRAE